MTTSYYCSTVREFEEARATVEYAAGPEPTQTRALVPFHPPLLNPSYETISDTFRFLFDKFKKGIFVQIQGGRLKTFLEFSNEQYTNGWSRIVNIDEGEVNLSDPKVQPLARWYANNYLVRYENPFNENHTGVAELFDLMKEVCDARQIPDVEFFINRRDFPLIRKDGHEPYSSIFGAKTRANAPPKLGLVVSMVGTADTLDIPFITPDDWSRCTKRTFSTTKRSLNVFEDDCIYPWESKRDIVIFRGSNTGINFGEKRILACEMCARDPMFDVKLTTVSARKQILEGKLKDPSKCGVPDRARPHMGKYVSLKDQSKYKYILHIEGHVQSFRLGTTLALGSVVLLVESKSKLWFEKELIAWKHYVPVKEDMSDLLEKAGWCKSHPFECKEIAKRSKQFYEERLTKGSCLDYVANLLTDYRRACAPALYTTPSAKPSGIISPSGRCFISIMSIDPLKELKGSSQIVCRTSAATTTLLVPVRSKLTTCVAVKRGQAVAYEYKIGESIVNNFLKEVPNFAYTFLLDRDSLYIEVVTRQRYTLKNYIRSVQFRRAGLFNILKQLALSLAFAQNRNFFIHGDAGNLDNVLLSRLPFAEYDVPVGHAEVWRVTCEELTPIWINYGTSSGVTGEGMLLSKTRPPTKFPSFLDCSRLLLSSIKEALRIGTLPSKQKQLCLDLVNTIFGVKTEKELHALADEPCLYLSPMFLFHSIEDGRFRRVEGARETHFGKVSSIYRLPAEKSSLLNRYYYQRLSKIALGAAITFLKSNAPRFTPVDEGWYIRGSEVREGKIYKVISPRSLNLLNVIEAVLADNSEFKLSEEERINLLKKSSGVLELKPSIWAQAVAEWS